MKNYKHKNLTRQIIKGYYEVYNELGTGFLESVYEKAMQHILNDYGLKVKTQEPIEVNFRGTVVGSFKADLMIEDKVIVELKAVKKLLPEHKAQLLNYLKATKIEIGLLMNFGEQPEFKRLIFNKQ